MSYSIRGIRIRIRGIRIRGIRIRGINIRGIRCFIIWKASIRVQIEKASIRIFVISIHLHL